MTVESTDNRKSYLGDGSSTAFTTPRFLANADLKVIVVDADGTEHEQVLDSDFTASGAGDASGTVTFVTAPASGTTVVILNDPELTQPLELVTGGALPAKMLEGAYDRSVYISQRLSDRVDRTLHLSDGDTDLDMVIPAKADRASKLLGFDADGLPIAAEGSTADVTVSTFAATVLDDDDAAAARTTLAVPGLAVENTLTKKQDIDLATAGALLRFLLASAEKFRFDLNAAGALELYQLDGTDPILRIHDNGKWEFAPTNTGWGREGSRYYFDQDAWVYGNLRVGLPDAFQGDEVSVTSITRSSTTATVTATGHGFTTGDNVLIQGADQEAYNGVFSVTVSDTDTFTYTVADTADTPATGTITVRKVQLFDPNGCINIGRTQDAEDLAFIRFFRQNAEKARMGLNDSDQFTVFAGSSNTEALTVSANAQTGLSQPNSAVVQQISATNASYASTAQNIDITRAGNSAFEFIRCSSNADATADQEFKVRGDGEVTADGAFTGSGADYAEYFEWEDGNPNAEDRVGLSVVLEGDKIRPAVEGDKLVLGIVSARPTVAGDGAALRWRGKYLKDAFGRYIMEDYEAVEWTETIPAKIEEIKGRLVMVEKEQKKRRSFAADAISEGMTPPADAKWTTLQRRKLNPEFDPSMTYVPRSQRPEWAAVGLMGKLPLRKGQPTSRMMAHQWRKLRDINDETELWLVL